MEDVRNVSIAHPPTPVSDTTNLLPEQIRSVTPESQNIYIEMEPAPTPRRAHTAIIIEPAPAQAETIPLISIPARFQLYTGILYPAYAIALLYMFPSLIALVGVKFQNKPHGPFETDSLFANMAVVAYIIAIPMPIALLCLKARLARESFSPLFYEILHCVLCFWSLLAPLSFVLVLFLPHGLGFIGYLIVFILFVVVVACSFSNCICKEDASNLEAHTRSDTWSHSTLTITNE